MNTRTMRALLQVEIDTQLAYREMRGQKFLEMIRSDLWHRQIWKELESDPELIAVEREMLEAGADVKVGRSEMKHDRRPWPWSELLPVRRLLKGDTERARSHPRAPGRL